MNSPVLGTAVSGDPFASSFDDFSPMTSSDELTSSDVDLASSDDNSATSFADLGLPRSIVRALADDGIVHPFPIQLATINDALNGHDVLGKGRTGSGKTLAFGLPLLARLATGARERRKFRPRAVVLVPTRELANQVRDVLAPLASSVDLRTTVIYGGVGYGKQIEALRNGVDIVVACPGRFVDHMNSGNVNLDSIEIAVLDEADHMAELGFLEDVRKVLDEVPQDAQKMLFSATLDRGIDKVVRRYLNDPRTHEVVADDVDDTPIAHHFLNVDTNHRFEVMRDLCAAPGKSLVFTRTKHGARKLAAALVQAGVPAVELHGDLSQAIRARNLAAFSGHKVDTLVATDIAARGIHVDDVALVIHADPPEEHKAFLHRSGRTARAGASGTVVTLVTKNGKRHVTKLARMAGINPEHHTAVPGSEILQAIAPGERTSKEMPSLETRAPRGPKKASSRDGGPRRGKTHRRDDFRRDERRDDRSENRRDDRRDDRRSDSRRDDSTRGDFSRGDTRRDDRRGDSRRDDSRRDDASRPRRSGYGARPSGSKPSGSRSFSAKKGRPPRRAGV